MQVCSRLVLIFSIYTVSDALTKNSLKWFVEYLPQMVWASFSVLRTMWVSSNVKFLRSLALFSNGRCMLQALGTPPGHLASVSASPVAVSHQIPHGVGIRSFCIYSLSLHHKNGLMTWIIISLLKMEPTGIQKNVCVREKECNLRWFGNL